MVDVNKGAQDEETLRKALEFLSGFPQFQIVKDYFLTRRRQTELGLEIAKNEEILEARGRWKEAKLIVSYLNK